MSNSDAFLAVPDSTVKVNVTTVRQATSLKNVPADRKRFQVRVVNKSGGSDAWIRFGGDKTTVTAVVNQSTLVPAGNTEAFTVPEGTNCFDVITEAGTATLYVETGEGV